MSNPAFGRYWTAATLSSLGTAVTTVALPVLVVRDLHASPVQVGVVNAAGFLPYAALGLVAGALVDRWPRRPVVVWASIGRAFALACIPTLWVLHRLDVASLVAALLAFGACSVFGFAATQSLLPRLVPVDGLVRANARLDQSDAAAQTLGPALGGAVVGVLGAPLAVALDALSYLLDAGLVASVRVDETRGEPGPRHLAQEVREGLHFTYRHAELARLALSTHAWFVGHASAMTVLALLCLRRMGFSATGYGLVMAGFGVASLVGAHGATWLGRHWGSRGAVVTARWAYPVGWALVAVAPFSALGRWMVALALAVVGLAAGLENPNEMGLWQSLTPDELMGRVNATRRSANRTLAALGALGGGALAGAVGERRTLVVSVAVLVAAALVLGLPRGRRPARGPRPT